MIACHIEDQLLFAAAPLLICSVLLGSFLLRNLAYFFQAPLFVDQYGSTLESLDRQDADWYKDQIKSYLLIH